MNRELIETIVDRVAEAFGLELTGDEEEIEAAIIAVENVFERYDCSFTEIEEEEE